MSSANKQNRSSKSNVIFPGIGQPLKRSQQQNNGKHSGINIINSSKPTDSTAEIKLPSNVTNLVEEPFELDWVDSTKNQSGSSSDRLLHRSKLNKTARLSSKINVGEQKSTIDTQTAGNNNLYISISAKMQSAPSTSQMSPASRSGNQSVNESARLDMSNNELINQNDNFFYDDENLDGQLADGAPEVKQSLASDYNQLDEPILDTLLRDLSGIYNKMKIIALPLSSYDIYKIVLRGWDLWGPLLLCTFLAFNLHHSESRDNHLGPHFADVFVLVWFGSCIISLNYRLLSLSSINNRTITSQLGTLSNNQQQTRTEELTKYDDSRAGDSSSGMSNTKIMMSQYETPFQTLMSPPSIFQLMCVFGYCLVSPCFGLIILKIFSFNRLFFERVIVGLLFGFAWPTVCSVKILIRYQHPDKRALATYPIGLFYFVLSCMIILNH